MNYIILGSIIGALIGFGIHVAQKPAEHKLTKEQREAEMLSAPYWPRKMKRVIWVGGTEDRFSTMEEKLKKYGPEVYEIIFAAGTGEELAP